MAALIHTASSVLRYRGGAGQLAWAIHRAAGLGVLAFLLLHIFDIFLAAFGPQLFNDLLFLYKGWLARVLETLLLFVLLYHALNGLRLILMDFFPIVASRKITRNFIYIQLGVFLLLFIPAGFVMLYSLPADQFGQNAAFSILITLGIIALPAVIVALFSLTPVNRSIKLDTDSGVGNYQDGFDRIVASRSHRVMNRVELNIWLFLRISGLLLIVLALGHFFLMHFIYGVENMDFNFIIERWMDPHLGLFWRGYDLALLFFALVHGMFGLRYSIEDYVHNHGLKMALLGLAVLVEVAMLAMGAFVIFSFNYTI